MRLLSIDPGLVCCGWATWVDGNLFQCGLSRTTKKGLEERVHAHTFPSMHAVNWLVIERPQVYQQRLHKGDPNDLIGLAMVVGGIITRVEPHKRVQTVLPHEWKGNVPTEVLEKRIAGKLSEKERKAMAEPIAFGWPMSTPKSLLHNMVDAVGVGLWALGR